VLSSVKLDGISAETFLSSAVYSAAFRTAVAAQVSITADKVVITDVTTPNADTALRRLRSTTHTPSAQWPSHRRRLVAGTPSCSVGYHLSVDTITAANAAKAALATLAEDNGTGAAASGFTVTFRAAFSEEATAAGVVLSLPATLTITGKRQQE
jgi:hypothetical protein